MQRAAARVWRDSEVAAGTQRAAARVWRDGREAACGRPALPRGQRHVGTRALAAARAATALAPAAATAAQTATAAAQPPGRTCNRQYSLSGPSVSARWYDLSAAVWRPSDWYAAARPSHSTASFGDALRTHKNAKTCARTPTLVHMHTWVACECVCMCQLRPYLHMYMCMERARPCMHARGAHMWWALWYSRVVCPARPGVLLDLAASSVWDPLTSACATLTMLVRETHTNEAGRTASTNNMLPSATLMMLVRENTHTNVEGRTANTTNMLPGATLMLLVREKHTRMWKDGQPAQPTCCQVPHSRC
eukprot:349956-Chlamydomonas_euryale.AAC.1